MKDSFPLQQFRDAFEVTTKVKNKLQPFIAKYKEQNMSWILKSLQELHRLFFEKDVQLHLKFNSIFGIKFIFDIGDQILVNFIEIYFLPKIVEIANYEINISGDKRGTTYFVKEGYPKSHQDAAKFGYNFVRMANEFIPAAALVKPRRVFEGEELHQKSGFAEALIDLQKKGWKPYPSPVYYKDGVAAGVRHAFEVSLQQQAVDNYVDYYSKIFKQFIVEDKMPRLRLNPFKIIQFCDSYVTAALVQMCQEQFRNPSLKIRKKTLELLNSMILWGDIEAAHLVNCTALLDETIAQISDPTNTSQVLSRGRSTFKKNNSSETVKQEFYVQLLRCIQFWALCYPKGIKIQNRDSKVKFWYTELRTKLQIEFPDDKDLKKNKTIFDQASRLNAQRNKILLSELKELDSELQPLQSLNSIYSGHIEKPLAHQPAPQYFNETPTPQGPPMSGDQGSSYNRIKKEMMNVSGCLNTLCDSSSQVDAKIHKINSFMTTYESQMENAIDMSNEQFDEILSQADILIERIQKLNPAMEKYKGRKITFNQFVDLVQGKKPASPQKKSQIKIQSKNQINDMQNESLNSSGGVLPQIQQVSLNSVKSPKKGQSKLLNNQKPQSTKKIEDITPIKQIKEEFDDHEKFEDSKDLSSLPQYSRKSVEMKNESFKNISKPDFKKNMNSEEVNIQPASHTILDGSKASEKKISPEKNSFKRFQDSHQHESQKKIPEKEKHQSSKRFVDSNEPEPEKKTDSLKHISNRFVGSEEELEKKVEPIQQSFKRFMESEENKVEEKIKPSVQQSFKRFMQSDENKFEEQIKPAVQSSFKKIIENDSPIKPQTSSKHLIEELNGNMGQLHEEIQQNLTANIPKSLKNITGSSKLQNLQSPAENLFKGQDSRKSSKIKFEESKIQKIEDDDENDIIVLPDSNPLDESYHEIKFHDTSSSLRNPNELSFKKCFQGDKYLFGQDRHIKKYKLANDTFNLIKRSDSSRKASRNKDSKISIPSLLDQRNKKFEEEIKYVQEKKNRKISELQTKIRLLENNGAVMQDKITQQEREIKTIKAFSEADNSRVKRNSLLEDQDAIFKAKLATVQNKSVKNQNFYQSRKDPRYLDPTGTLINSRKYKEYFQQFTNQKQKKNLLKSKELLLKNEEIEFGCMAKRDRQTLMVVFYITPASDLDGLVSRIVTNDSNLEIELEPKNIPSIRKGKQEKVTAHIHVKNIPFHLPEIEFSYNLQHKLDTQKFVVPCAFHKFIHLASTDEREIARQFERRDKILRGEEVPYSKKLLKNIGNLSDYFSGGILMRSGQPNPNGEIEFGGKAKWRHEEFWIRLMVRPNQFLYVQAIPDSNPQVAEYYVSLITNLLMKNIDLKEM